MLMVHKGFAKRHQVNVCVSGLHCNVASGHYVMMQHTEPPMPSLASSTQ